VGAFLTSLDIDVSPPDDLSLLALDEDDRRSFKAAVQRLTEFNFSSRVEEAASFWPTRRTEEVDDLGKLLTTMLDTETLRTIRLNFGFLWDNERPPAFSLGSIFNLRTWPNLVTLRLVGVPLHVRELERFVERLSSSVDIITIDSMHLLSGTWLEGLDILRRKATPRTDFESPYGAECDEMSGEETQAIFGKDYSNGYHVTAKAETYIRGGSDENPLKRSDVMDVE
jgi:hypothetical protein